MIGPAKSTQLAQQLRVFWELESLRRDQWRRKDALWWVYGQHHLPRHYKVSLQSMERVPRTPKLGSVFILIFRLMDSMSGTIRPYKICLSRSQSQRRKPGVHIRHVFLPITRQGMNRVSLAPSSSCLDAELCYQSILNYAKQVQKKAQALWCYTH